MTYLAMLKKVMRKIPGNKPTNFCRGSQKSDPRCYWRKSQGTITIIIYNNFIAIIQQLRRYFIQSHQCLPNGGKGGKARGHQSH